MTDADVTERDRNLVEQYLDSFLRFAAAIGPDCTVGNNMRWATEEMVTSLREDD